LIFGGKADAATIVGSSTSSAASTPTLHTHTGIIMGRLKDKIWDAAEAIDIVFGEGYAKKNPELVGRVLQSEALTEGAQEVVNTLHRVSMPSTLKTSQ